MNSPFAETIEDDKTPLFVQPIAFLAGAAVVAAIAIPIGFVTLLALQASALQKGRKL